MTRALLPLMLCLALAACGRGEPAAPPAAEEAAATPAGPADAPPAPPSGPGPGEVPRAFLCRGSEPFWSLDIGGGAALLKTPDSETLLEGPLKALAGGAYAFQGAPADAPSETVAAMLSPAQCFDTLAGGPARPFSAVVSFAEGGEGSGCCEVEYGLDMASAPVFDPATAPADAWTRELPSLADAIARCVADAGVATEAVTRAWPTNHGKATVRLRDAGAARFDCRLDLGSGNIEAVAEVAAGDVAPGEGRPVYLPARDAAPVLHCGRVERVLGPGGQLRGYLHHGDGCV